ncbi:MAG TPA: hypothetical protein VGB77_22170 [Abditibacteriaceae bacterium]|jgi:hypothetical protein
MPKPIIVSAAQVKKSLAGTSMARFINALGTTEQERNTEIETLVREAQSEIETQCSVHLIETRIVSRSGAAGLTRRTAQAAGDYDKLEDAYTYHADDFTRGPVSVRLKKRPVVSIQGAALRWSSEAQGQLWRFPQDWMAPEARLGHIHIVALYGSGVARVNNGTLMLPILGGMMRSNAVPLLFSVAYTAGFLPYDFNPDEDDLNDACPDFEEINMVAAGVKALAALKILKNTRFAKGAGGGSVAIDGISQTHQAGRFQQEIADLTKDVKDAKDSLKEFTGGVDFMIA